MDRRLGGGDVDRNHELILKPNQPMILDVTGQCGGGENRPQGIARSCLAALHLDRGSPHARQRSLKRQAQSCP